MYIIFFFVQIFGPQTNQQDVYDHTMREMVRDVLRGENRLLYTYGVTNSGKTYTIQGKMAITHFWISACWFGAYIYVKLYNVIAS